MGAAAGQLSSEPSRSSAVSGSVVATAGTDSMPTVIAVIGLLDGHAGAELARLTERALMAAVPGVSFDLAALTGFTPEGIEELSQAVVAGRRFRRGVTLDLSGKSSRDAMLAVCRWRVDRKAREGARRPGERSSRR